ncbi:MAG: hypothetical protein ACQESO_00130 [Bacillota bacterium]
MIKHYSILSALLIIVFLVLAACGNEEKQLPPTGTSVGGSVLETGLEIDQELLIISAQTTFMPNEIFYFYFYNNAVFGSGQVTVQLVENSNEKVLAQSNYEVDPDDDSLTDKIWFGSPGRYTIVVKVGGEIRATQEVIIE